MSKEIQRDILDVKILLSGKPSVAEQGDKDDTISQEQSVGFHNAGHVDGDAFLPG